MNTQISSEKRARLAGSYPAILVSFLFLWASHLYGASPDRQSTKLAHGFSYQHDEISQVPWSIHIVKVDRSNSDLELDTSLAKGIKFGLATVNEQIRTLPLEYGRPVAAINGDYFKRNNPYLGDPKGLQIFHGQLVSGPSDWTCFWIDATGHPLMTNVVARFEVTWPDGAKTPFGLNEERGANAAVLYTSAVGTTTQTRGGRELVLERHGTNVWLPLRPGQTYSALVREAREVGDTPLSTGLMILSLGRQLQARVPKVTPGTVLQISTATFPDLAGAKTAIGGGPPIVRDGKDIAHSEMYIRHPRAAVGWNNDYFFLVEVDGRQRHLSVGMTLPELANYMIKLGCTEAMNLDGGGSATCWVYGQVMNSPSEGRERGMGNALVLIQKEKK